MDFIFALLAVLSIACFAVSTTPINHCVHTKDAPVLPRSLLFPEGYTARAVFSDWFNNYSIVLEEVRLEERISVKTLKRNEPTQLWTNIFSQYLHVVGKDCVASDKENVSAIPLPIAIAEIISLPTSSLNKLVSEIVNRNDTGYFSGTSVVSGREGVSWIACANSSSSSTGLMIEVVYADKTIEPVLPAFKNPTLLALSFTVFPNISDANATATSHVSLQLFPFDEPSPLTMASELVCSGLPLVDSLVQFPDSFVAMIDVRGRNGSNFSSEFVYDAPRNMTVQLFSKGKNAIVTPSDPLPPTAFLTIQDHQHGASAVFTPAQCALSSLAPAPLPSAHDLLIPPLNYSLYSNVSGVREYRGSSGPCVFSISVSSSTSFSVRKTCNGVWETETKVTLRSSSGSGEYTRKLNDCFASSVPLQAFTLQGLSMDRLRSIGSDFFARSVQTHVASVASISPSRIRSSFMDATSPNDVRVLLWVADEFVGGKEASAEEALRAFNQSLLEGHQVVVWGEDGTSSPFSSLSGLTLFPGPSSSFVGFTGGSMFVLGLFTFVFGVSLGAGAVYVVTRKQRISTLAYQVFE